MDQIKEIAKSMYNEIQICVKENCCKDFLNYVFEDGEFVKYFFTNDVFDVTRSDKGYGGLTMDEYTNMSAEDIEKELKEFIKDEYAFCKNNMNIREYFEKRKVEDGRGTYVTAEPINQYVDEFFVLLDVKTFYKLVEKDEDWRFYINEDVDGDLFVTGNEGCHKRYFDDNIPMVEVYWWLINTMYEVIEEIELETVKEIKKETKYKVLDSFEYASACEHDSNFNVDYDEWWVYVLGETKDWIKDNCFNEFCDVLHDYFVEYAEDYGYDVKEVDGGLDLEKK